MDLQKFDFDQNVEERQVTSAGGAALATPGAASSSAEEPPEKRTRFAAGDGGGEPTAWVDFSGFSTESLNGRYEECSDMLINGSHMYKNGSGMSIWWCSKEETWAMGWLDQGVEAGRPLDGAGSLKSSHCLAVRRDPGTFASPDGWEELGRAETLLWVVTAGTAAATDDYADRLRSTNVLSVRITGLARETLNGRYLRRDGADIQGCVSYWHENKETFLYWQSSKQQWAICDVACERQVLQGQEVGWVICTSQGPWMQFVEGESSRAWEYVHPHVVVTTAGLGCLAVQLSGFSSSELNAVYTQKVDVKVHEEATFWTPCSKYFIYWHAPFKLWAIGEASVLPSLASGGLHALAYRSARGWHELNGVEWSEVSASCRLLRGQTRPNLEILLGKQDHDERTQGKNMFLDAFRKELRQAAQDSNRRQDPQAIPRLVAWMCDSETHVLPEYPLAALGEMVAIMEKPETQDWFRTVLFYILNELCYRLPKVAPMRDLVPLSQQLLFALLKRADLTESECRRYFRFIQREDVSIVTMAEGHGLSWEDEWRTWLQNWLGEMMTRMRSFRSSRR